ncbi:MAG: SH3 domain-containing protein [Dysosmobacter sp.]
MLAAAGWDSAVMLDGGGSVCYRDRAGNGFVCDADRVIPYYLVVHLADDVSESDTTGGQYVVTAQSGLNIRKGPGTSFDKLGGYAYGAVVAVQAVRDGWGQTDRGWVSMDYLRPVEAAEEGLVTDTGLRIIQDILPSGADNRPGGSNPDTYITIHETGNFAKGRRRGGPRGVPAGQLRPGGSGELALYRGRPQHLPAPAGWRAGLPRRGRRQRAGQRHQHRHRDLRGCRRGL